MSSPSYWGGGNIAMKIPPHQFDATVHFYRDIACLPELHELAPDIVFAFGGNRLWLDPAPGFERSEIWLELACRDRDAAEAHLAGEGVPFVPDAEPLPDGFPAFWVSNPASVIHLVCQRTPPVAADA